MNIKALRATLKIDRSTDGRKFLWIGLFPGGFRALGPVEDTPVADMLLMYTLMLSEECKRSLIEGARREMQAPPRVEVPARYDC